MCLREGLPSLPLEEPLLSARHLWLVVSWSGGSVGGAGHPPEPDGALRRLTSGEGDVPQTWPPGCRSPRDHPVGPQSTVSASELVWPRPSPLDSQPWQRGGLQKCLLGRTRRAWPGAESDGLCHWLLASGKSLAGPAGSCLGYGEGSGRGSRSHQFCGGGTGTGAVTLEAGGAWVTLSPPPRVMLSCPFHSPVPTSTSSGAGGGWGSGEG